MRRTGGALDVGPYVRLMSNFNNPNSLITLSLGGPQVNCKLIITVI